MKLNQNENVIELDNQWITLIIIMIIIIMIIIFILI